MSGHFQPGFCKQCGKPIKRRTYCSKACAGLARRTKPTAYRHSNGKYEHITVAERAIGKLLPKDARVHHVDENRLNNAPTNLVICEDQAYHKLLHYRMRAYRECGDPNKLRCKVCKVWDEPARLYVGRPRAAGRQIYHVSCATQYNKKLLQLRNVLRKAGF